MTESQETVEERLQRCVHPPGSCSSGEKKKKKKRKEGSGGFCGFLAPPCFKYKAATHANSPGKPSESDREDRPISVCLCVSAPALMDQMAGQESWECLQTSLTVR